MGLLFSIYCIYVYIHMPAQARPDIAIDFSSSFQHLLGQKKKKRLPGRPVVADSDYAMTATAVMMILDDI